MSAIGAIEIVELVLKLTDKVLDFLPDYDQRKKEKYLKLKRQYDEEKSKDYPNRDDNLVGKYRDELLRYITIFSTEVSGPEVSTLPKEGS